MSLQPQERVTKLLRFSALALLLLAVVPLWPWRPACRCKTVWWGDLRDEYVSFVAEGPDRRKISYWRVSDLILLRPLPWLDGHEIVSRSDALHDTEGKVAQMLGNDVTIDGVFYPAPEGLKRLKVEMAEAIGPDPRFGPDAGRRIAADTRITLFCPLFRAAVLEPAPRLTR